jgi:hypothetical protein
LTFQTPADFFDRQPIAANPLEQLLHYDRLVRDNLIGGRARAGVLGYIPISKWSAAQYVHTAAPRCVTLAAPTSFEDLGTLVLGDHPLHLQQQVFFGRNADGPVEKHQSTPQRCSSSTNSTW